MAGVSYFNPAVLGQPVVWPGGQVMYLVDQGALNAQVSNQQATAMVDAAAAIWSAVPTAGVSLTDGGSLAEDVSGADVVAANGVFEQPADVTPGSQTAPVGVIFDADGSVIDALEGVGASEPDNCSQNGVLVWIDNMDTNADLVHGVMVLNGRCATTPALMSMMSYQVERGFGRILGLDFSQVNDNALTGAGAETNAVLGWPVMQPLSGDCSAQGGICIPNPGSLRLDDIAALNRLYPVTAANVGSFPGKVLTAANTVSIQGTIRFRNGEGMQGVNVVARPLDASGNPLYQYTVTAVSGVSFAGNRGNPVTGWTDAYGNRLDRFGSNAASLQGFFDLSGMPLPNGVTLANYEITFEAVNPLYIDEVSVGPYVLGSPAPSGTMAPIAVPGMVAGGSQTLTVEVANSANGPVAEEAGAGGQIRGPGVIGQEGAPQLMPANGMWTGRLGVVGQSDWFTAAVRGNRIFTVVTQALDEKGNPTASKAMPAIGVWDAFDLTGTAAVGWAAAQNGLATGETWLQVATAGNDVVRLGVADERGDGRPDYVYRGWMLYADTVAPARLPAGGGTIVIRGMGFRPGDTVQVGGVAAQVVSVRPTEITAMVGPANGVTGSMDVEVDDLPQFSAMAVIPSGVSYDAGSGDALHVIAAPQGEAPMSVPQAFAVSAWGGNLQPAGGVTVTFAVVSGTATLGCGQTSCAVAATGDGLASMLVTANDGNLSIVSASLTNGASVQAQFYGGAPPAIAAITPTLYLAAGAMVNWPVQALALNGSLPAAGETVSWQSAPGMTAPLTPATANAAGVAGATLAVGPLSEGQTVTAEACVSGTANCAAFQAFGSRPEFAGLAAVSGTNQSLPMAQSPMAVTMRVLDMDGNPMAGGTVTVHEALYAWTPACPRHGRCAQAQLLATQSLTLISGLDGSVTFAPLTKAGQATSLQGLAVTGNAGSLTFSVEEHP